MVPGLVAADFGVDTATGEPSSHSITETGLPRHRQDGKWTVSFPGDQGFDTLMFNRAVQAIAGMEGVCSVLVVRNHYLVAERYMLGSSPENPCNLKSATKSILSALAGIAVEKGFIRLDQAICDFLPYVGNVGDVRKMDITVRHLLTMTSGLEPTSYQAYNEWVTNDDWVLSILSKPLAADPGTLHQYSTGDAHILAAVLTAATGMGVRDFACRYLFDPMGITVYGWSIDPQGIQQGGNNLSLLPRDMAAIGQLYLDGGWFGNQSVVPHWWIEASTRSVYMGSHDVYGYYGYLWYTRPFGHNDFVAVGFGGQYIYVSPDDNLVIVITSSLDSKGDAWERQLFDIIHNSLLTSLVSRDGRTSAPGLKQQGSEAPGEPEILTRKGIVMDVLNLRKGPGTSYGRQMVLNPGTILDVNGSAGGWLKVSAGKQNGWVSDRFVRIVGGDELTLSDFPALPLPVKDVDTDDSPGITTQLPSPILYVHSSARDRARNDPGDVSDNINQELKTIQETADRASTLIGSLNKELTSARNELVHGFQKLGGKLDGVADDLTRIPNASATGMIRGLADGFNQLTLRITALEKDLGQVRKQNETLTNLILEERSVREEGMKAFSGSLDKIHKGLMQSASILPAPAAVVQEEKKTPDIHPEIQAPSDTPHSRAVELVRNWEAAWEAKDIDRYLACYSRAFETPGGVVYDTWARLRRDRIRRPEFIDITITNLIFQETGPACATIMFQQEYRSDLHRDKVVKTLGLVWEKEKWVIMTERSRQCK